MNSRTSITDNDDFPSTCKRLAEDDGAFQTFKRDPIFTKALEHTTKGEALIQLGIIQRQTPWLLLGNAMNRFRINDQIGSPRSESFPEIGNTAPTTIQYIKVLSDLITLFGNLDALTIVEIGAGYGGQCKVVLDAFPFARYVIVDLPEVLQLQKRYHRAANTAGVEYLAADDILHGNRQLDADLVVSNYAFTECTREVQYEYISRIFRHARRGYITCNFISKLHGVKSFRKSELIRLLPRGRLIDEVPCTHLRNRIYVWGDRPKPRSVPSVLITEACHDLRLLAHSLRKRALNRLQ